MGQGEQQIDRALRVPQPQEAVGPAYLSAAAEGAPVAVAARRRVAVVQVTARGPARRQDDQGRVEETELHRLAAIDVQRRVLEAPGDDAELGGVQDRLERRTALEVALPEGLLVGQENEVSAPVVQVGQRPPRFPGMRRRGRVCAGEVRKVWFAKGGFLVQWHPLLPPDP